MTPDIYNLPPDSFVDIHLTDLFGGLRALTVPAARLTREFIEEGLSLDGSSFPGWQPIHASDMVLRPDPATLFENPYRPMATWGLIGRVFDPHTDEPYSRDPRHVSLKAESYLKSTGLADTAYVGPEAEFFVFSEAGFKNEASGASFKLRNREAPELFGNPRPIKPKSGFAMSSPADSYAAFRSELARDLVKFGLEVEVLHHEAASGQCEIGFRFDSLTRAADKLALFKYAVKSGAAKAGLAATFMPKPLLGDNGSGLHLNFSLFKDGQPLFSGSEYGGLSAMAIHFIGGLLAHAPALCAFTNAATNSYRRLVPGFEAPNRLAYSARNRSAAVRIPSVSGPKAKRVEARFPDPSANGYLAMAAILMAGLDGVMRRLDPGAPLDRDIYALSPEENHLAPFTPASLSRALTALEDDHAFLLKGDVFTTDLVETYLKMKWDREVSALRQRPHPFEYEIYFDC